jgi:hypothetical protein
MKPTFALDLTREAVALLHRTPKGWLPIGEVPFDAPDLAEGLDYLRKTALGLSPMGMACKLILPNSQILYTEVHAPGPSREDKRRQIATALEGRTPYAVEDLVFDWSGKGQTVKVAVVARETLEEAEAFAATHRLNPVSFVAIPEAGEFVGEPWFGPSSAAEAILAPGESVDRDREPVSVLQRDPPPAAAPAVAAAPEEAPAEAPAEEPAVLPGPASEVVATAPAAGEDDPLPGLEEALNAELPLAPPAGPAPAPAGPEDSLDDLDEAELAAALAEALADAPAAAALPDPAPAGADRIEPQSAAPVPQVADALPSGPDTPAVNDALSKAVPSRDAGAAPVVEVDEAPFAHVTDTAAFPDDQDPPQRPPVAAPAPDDDLPPAPPAAALVAFASRRAGAAPVAERPLDGVARPSAPPAASGPKVAQPQRPAPAARSFQGLVTAPTIPGTRPRPKGKPGLPEAGLAAAAGTGPVTVKSPARPGGTFGTPAPARNRSGVALMLMIGLLLLFLAFIAAVSSYFLSQNGAGETDSARLADPIAVIPAVDDEMLADMQDPEGMTDPLPEAAGPALAAGDAGALATESLATESLATERLADANLGDTPSDPVDLAATVGAASPDPAEAPAAAATAVEPAPEPVADLAADAAPEPAPEPAPDTVVATDVSAGQAPVEDQDEIFLSAMDAPPPALDALALPAPALVADQAPPAPMPPPAFGTVYKFDARGLLVPTPEGILSPEGVMLIAGPPPRVPPARSEAAAAAARAAAALAPPSAAEGAAPDPAADTTADATVLPEATVSAADASLVTADSGTEAADSAVAEEATAPADPALSGFRPRPRPDGLVPAPDDDAALDDPAATDFAGRRPLPRPQVVLAAAAAARPVDLGAQGASLAAQAEADLAAAAALEAANPSVVAISRRPEARPRDLSRAVEAAVAAAVRAPEPEVLPEDVAAAAPDLKPEEVDEIDEPAAEGAAPSIPTKASVAKQATFANAINLSKMNLIGTYGTDSRRSALIRQSNGRYKKVEVGDKIDGGTVMAITETEVRYQKGGKLLTLAMPKA